MGKYDEMNFTGKEILIGTIETLTKGLLGVLVWFMNSMDTKIDTIQTTVKENQITAVEAATNIEHIKEQTTANKNEIKTLYLIKQDKKK